MRYVMFAALVVAVVLAALFTGAVTTQADGYTYCPTWDEAVTIIAHKSDIEHGNPPRVKERLFQLASRESGMLHCWAGAVKISPTADHGLFQLNPGGVWRNCGINAHCTQWWMIDDVFAQVDVILNYYDRYGDFCPWNPATNPTNYNPGCGYR